MRANFFLPGGAYNAAAYPKSGVMSESGRTERLGPPLPDQFEGVTPPIFKCDACEGTGLWCFGRTIFVPCTVCEGTGSLQRELFL